MATGSISQGWQCDFCDYCTPNVFDQWSLLREHLRSSFLATDKDHLVLFTEGPFNSLTAVRCQICNRSFEKVAHLLHHVRTKIATPGGEASKHEGWLMSLISNIIVLGTIGDRKAVLENLFTKMSGDSAIGSPTILSDMEDSADLAQSSPIDGLTANLMELDLEAVAPTSVPLEPKVDKKKQVIIPAPAATYLHCDYCKKRVVDSTDGDLHLQQHYRDKLLNGDADHLVMFMKPPLSEKMPYVNCAACKRRFTKVQDMLQHVKSKMTSSDESSASHKTFIDDLVDTIREYSGDSLALKLQYLLITELMEPLPPLRCIVCDYETTWDTAGEDELHDHIEDELVAVDADHLAIFEDLPFTNPNYRPCCKKCFRTFGKVIDLLQHIRSKMALSDEQGGGEHEDLMSDIVSSFVVYATEAVTDSDIGSIHRRVLEERLLQNMYEEVTSFITTKCGLCEFETSPSAPPVDQLQEHMREQLLLIHADHLFIFNQPPYSSPQWRPYCNKCKKPFQRVVDLFQHIRSKMGQSSQKGEEHSRLLREIAMEFVVPGSTNNSQRSSSEGNLLHLMFEEVLPKKPVTCGVCSLVCGSERRLLEHYKDEFLSLNASHLDIFMQPPLSSASPLCDVCDRTFGKVTDLIQHIRCKMALPNDNNDHNELIEDIADSFVDYALENTEAGRLTLLQELEAFMFEQKASLQPSLGDHPSGIVCSGCQEVHNKDELIAHYEQKLLFRDIQHLSVVKDLCQDVSNFVCRLCDRKFAQVAHLMHHYYSKIYLSTEHKVEHEQYIRGIVHFITDGESGTLTKWRLVEILVQLLDGDKQHVKLNQSHPAVNGNPPPKKKTSPTQSQTNLQCAAKPAGKNAGSKPTPTQNKAESSGAGAVSAKKRNSSSSSAQVSAKKSQTQSKKKAPSKKCGFCDLVVVQDMAVAKNSNSDGYSRLHDHYKERLLKRDPTHMAVFKEPMIAAFLSTVYCQPCGVAFTEVIQLFQHVNDKLNATSDEKHVMFIRQIVKLFVDFGADPKDRALLASPLGLMLYARNEDICRIVHDEYDSAAATSHEQIQAALSEATPGNMIEAGACGYCDYAVQGQNQRTEKRILKHYSSELQRGDLLHIKCIIADQSRTHRNPACSLCKKGFSQMLDLVQHLRSKMEVEEERLVCPSPHGRLFNDIVRQLVGGIKRSQPTNDGYSSDDEGDGIQRDMCNGCDDSRSADTSADGSFVLVSSKRREVKKPTGTANKTKNKKATKSNSHVRTYTSLLAGPVPSGR